MSSEDWDKLEKNLGRIAQMAGLLRMVVVAGFSVVMAIAGLAVWVNQITTGLAATQQNLISLEAKRDQSLSEWTVWRRMKDDNDVRLTIAAENQQRLLERQQQQIDRQQQQIDRSVR